MHLVMNPGNQQIHMAMDYLETPHSAAVMEWCSLRGGCRASASLTRFPAGTAGAGAHNPQRFFPPLA